MQENDILHKKITILNDLPFQTLRFFVSWQFPLTKTQRKTKNSAQKTFPVVLWVDAQDQQPLTCATSEIINARLNAYIAG